MEYNSNKTIYHAGLYVRLSKEDGDVDTGNKYESNSISNQKELIMQFLISHPEIRIHSIREDDGYTGTNFNRPGFQLLLQDMKEKKINCIIVKDLSRVGRNYLKVGEYVQEVFPANGIRFISINDNYDSSSSSAQNDDIIISFKNLLNDAYSRDISIKIRSNLEVKRKKGEFTGAFTVFGYAKSQEDKNTLVADPYAAKVVKDIFAWKLDGMNQSAIAEKLNAMGIPSPMEYKRIKGSQFQTCFKRNAKAKWCAQSVARILTNEVYIGTLIQGKRSKPSYRSERVVVKNQAEWIRREQAHEPIIDELDFKRVQEILDRDTRTAPEKSRVYSYSGLLFCGDCKRSMVRKTVPGANGKKYVYFVCSNHKKTGACSSHAMKEELLEQTILETVQKHVSAVLDVDAILDELTQKELQKEEMEKLDERILWKEEEMEKYRRLNLSLYEDLREGTIDKEEYLYLKAEYQRKIEEAEEAVWHLRGEIEQVYHGTDERKKWVSVFERHAHMEQITRKTANQLFDRIYIYEDKRIGIRFKFQDKYDACMKFIANANRLLEMQKEAE